MKVKKVLFIILGCVGLALGAVGAVLPLLPAFPFLLLAAYSFARSSERLHKWFTGTKLYKNNLESFLKGKGMTKKTKIRIMVTVTLLMSVGFIMMHQVPVGRLAVPHLLLYLRRQNAREAGGIGRPCRAPPSTPERGRACGAAFTQTLPAFSAFRIAGRGFGDYNGSRKRHTWIAARPCTPQPVGTTAAAEGKKALCGRENTGPLC